MLPKPNAVFVPHDKTIENKKEFTEGEVRGLISNPVYAGIGPFQQVVDDEKWVRAAVELIHEQGAIQFLVNMLYVLRETFKS